VLERRGRLDASTLEKAMHDPARELRVHALRVVAERKEPGDAVLRGAREALKDGDAMVRRNAAEALGQHPSSANLRPLLDLRQAAPAEDTHLVHVVRMALRDQLRADSAWAELASGGWSERDARAIADVATGVPTAASAHYLLRHVGRVDEPQGTV